MSDGAVPDESRLPPSSQNDAGLKKLAPYWYPYTTMAKERWLGREILEIVSTEFRDRSMEYYVGASKSIVHLFSRSYYSLHSGTPLNPE
jgi:hypothetical protein